MQEGVDKSIGSSRSRDDSRKKGFNGWSLEGGESEKKRCNKRVQAPYLPLSLSPSLPLSACLPPNCTKRIGEQGLKLTLVSLVRLSGMHHAH
jgi:hypothetical protein